MKSSNFVITTPGPIVFLWTKHLPKVSQRTAISIWHDLLSICPQHHFCGFRSLSILKLYAVPPGEDRDSKQLKVTMNNREAPENSKNDSGSSSGGNHHGLHWNNSLSDVFSAARRPQTSGRLTREALVALIEEALEIIDADLREQRDETPSSSWEEGTSDQEWTEAKALLADCES